MRKSGMAFAAAVSALLLSSACVAQTKTIDPDARQQIDAGNQQWVDGMKQHDLRLLTALHNRLGRLQRGG